MLHTRGSLLGICTRLAGDAPPKVLLSSFPVFLLSRLLEPARTIRDACSRIMRKVFSYLFLMFILAAVLAVLTVVFRYSGFL